LTGVHKTAGADLEFQEAFTICSQRDLIVYSVAMKPKCAREGSFARFLQVETFSASAGVASSEPVAEVATIPA
jgi:hypothetical protein